MCNSKSMMEETQYCETIEITEKMYDRNSCVEYVVSSPKFSFKRWLILTAIFNALGILLDLQSQVPIYLVASQILVF